MMDTSRFREAEARGALRDRQIAGWGHKVVTNLPPSMAANPVAVKPGLGKWLKSQLPGGAKAMGVKQLPGAVKKSFQGQVVSPVVQKARAGSAGGRWAYSQLPGGPKAEDLRQLKTAVSPLLPVDAAKSVYEAGKDVYGGAKAGIKATEKALAGVTPAARKFAGGVADIAEDLYGYGKAAAGALEDVVKAVNVPIGDLLGGEKEKAGGVASNVPEGWYPDPGMGWDSEPGGKYLAARYPRQYGNWGMGTAGEGWANIAQRGGWDAHIHPVYSERALNAVFGKPYRESSGVRSYKYWE